MSRERRDVEAVHRLTGPQEAILVHRLRGEGAVDSGLVQIRATLEGPLDRRRLERAWAGTAVHRPALRSSVHWRELPHPVQVVTRPEATSSGAWTLKHRTLSSGEEAEGVLRELAAEDRQRGLDLGRAPVMRLQLLSWPGDHHLLLWTCHHLLLDGWSSALVLREVLERYASGPDAAGEEPARAEALSFRQYVAWTRSVSAEPAESFWSTATAGEGGPADLLAQPRLCDGFGDDGFGDSAVEGTGRGASPVGGRRVQRLESLASGAVEEWARRVCVSPSTLFVGTWALVLAETTGARRPVLGLTVSGRTADLAGIDNVVGMLSQALPLQLEVEATAATDDWFRRVFQTQQAVQRFAHCSLDRLFRAGGVALRRPPFDTLLAYANFPPPRPSTGAERGSDARSGLRLTDYRTDLTSTAPLSLAIEPGEPFRVSAHYAAGLLDDREVGRLLQRLETIAAAVVATPAAGAPPAGEVLGDLLEPAREGARRSARPTEPSNRARPSRGGDAATATPTEAQVMRIWNDLLGVREYGLDDNFFELGGHSLLVPQLIVRVRQDFGVELPLGAVLQAPTVRRLASAVGEATRPRAWPSLVPIRSGAGSHRRPLFMVHGLGGEVGWFYNLANYLDPEVPLYGLQAPEVAFEQLDPMASAYLEEVRGVQAEGPYRLGGYCIGGGAAFEMARQLTEAGAEVELLVLIDSVPQAYAGQSGGPGLGGGTGLAGRLRNLARKPPREMVASVADAGARFLRRRLRTVGMPGDGPVELEDVLDMRTLPAVYHDAARRHFRAMRDYEPSVCSGGCVHLLRTADERFGDDFGWGRLVEGDLVVERVTGRHIDVLKEPHVRDVGRRVSRALKRGAARAGAAGRPVD